MALIIPKCNADSETLKYTLKVYYDANNWVSNSSLIDRLSQSLIDAGIETERKEPQSYTKKTQVLSYYALIEWEDPLNIQSRRRITENGKKIYELGEQDDKSGIQKLLVTILQSQTFGRNVLGCDSNSDLEAPNIFLKSTMILGNLTNKEFAYIIGRMELDKKEFGDVLFEVFLKRKQGIIVTPSSAASKWADPKPILALADWGLFETQKDGNSKLYYLDNELITTLGEELINLRIKNTDAVRTTSTEIVLENDKANGFAYGLFKHFYDIDKLHAISHLFKKGQEKEDKTRFKIEDSSLYVDITGVFVECTSEYLKTLNSDTNRWYDTPFDLGNAENWFLAYGWSKPEDGKSEPSGHTIINLKKIVEKYYPLYSVQIKNSAFSKYRLIKGSIHASNITSQSLPSYNSYEKYLAAMRTKPFLLLAGISGTGKSRIVKEMAFDSCPLILRDKDHVSPGNYCMIEVKPNWHDSTELMGYESHIGNKHYVVTPFIKFLIKAMHHKDVPFFVCLDEMNLAPVEQYFAEFLSVLESRKLVDGRIVSEPLIKANIMHNYITDFIESYHGIKPKYSYDGSRTEDPQVEYESDVFNELQENGLRLPSNVIVIGTVNMDETTYQFSRKVIDRAMTIEINEVNFKNMFGDENRELDYSDIPTGAGMYLPKQTSAKDIINGISIEDTDKEILKDELVNMLNTLNSYLEHTPFRVAYRVENEIILYFSSLREFDKKTGSKELLYKSLDDILMMKVLPRIEGNEDLLEKPLEYLDKFTKDIYPNANKKISEMLERLRVNHFTSYWP